MYHTNPNDVIWALRGHKRTPNLAVRCLYRLGEHLVDFGIMFVYLFNVVYNGLRRLFAFIVGLLIELSTVIVLMGTIVFSIAHTIELFRRGGATGGLEYIGVAMFEVVFIASTAKLTGNLMKGQRPDWFSIGGFGLSICFVEWSNISGMADNWTGHLIGFFTPILLIISEGVLAFQHRGIGPQDNARKILENHPHLTERDLLNAIQMYLDNQKADTGQTNTTNATREVAVAIASQDEVIATTNAREVVDAIANRKTGDASINEETRKTGGTIASEDTRKAGDIIAREEAREVGEAATHKEISEFTSTAATIASEEVRETGDASTKKTEGDIARKTDDATSTSIASTKKSGDVTSTKKTGDATIANKTGDHVHRHLRVVNDPEVELVKKVAMEIYRNEGKLPGRPRLREETGCTDHKAKKALQELKEELGIAS